MSRSPTGCSVSLDTGRRGKRGLTPPQPQPLAAGAPRRPRRVHQKSEISEQPACGSALATPRVSRAQAFDGRRGDAPHPARSGCTHGGSSASSAKSVRPTCGAVPVRSAREKRAREAAARPRSGAVPRPRRRRGWGGVRLLCGRGAVAGGAGLNGAAGRLGLSGRCCSKQQDPRQTQKTRRGESRLGCPGRSRPGSFSPLRVSRSRPRSGRRPSAGRRTPRGRRRGRRARARQAGARRAA